MKAADLRPLTSDRCSLTYEVSVTQPSRHKDQQIYRESEDYSRPRLFVAPLRQFPDHSRADRRGRFA